MATYLLLDCNNLAYRAFWVTGHLSHGGDPTGTIYGFLKNLPLLQSFMNTTNLVFCFDHGKSLREKLGVGYKENRRLRKLTEEQEDALIGMRNQVQLLRKKYLPAIGFKNIFYQKGYEADDIIASVVHRSLKREDEAVIISSDKDLWQLLSDRVWMYDPTHKKAMTKKIFLKEWNLDPIMWSQVKAIAGCKTDGVPGVRGIGEKTAAKYLRGEYTDRVQKMILKGFKTVEKNAELVVLPYRGVKTFEIQKDEVSRKSWQSVVEQMGMRSLTKNPPIFKETLV